MQWNLQDAAGLLAEMLTPGGKDVRALHLPTLADKLDAHYDRITLGGSDIEGNSAYTGYTPNRRAILSLALVDPSVQIGNKVVIHWGEAGGGYGDAIVPATNMSRSAPSSARHRTRASLAKSTGSAPSAVSPDRQAGQIGDGLPARL